MRRKGPWRYVASPSLTFGSSSGSLDAHAPATGSRARTEGAVPVRRKPVAYVRIEQRLPCPAHV
ncbi:hypothetical protein GCM10010317_030810 [Streptomyces mirabilis]|nr:hypothetical protein GCM10010317_030810 [Streptomyces mirabilis]